MRGLFTAAATLSLIGCAADIGGGSAFQPRDGHAVLSGEVAVSSKPASAPLNTDGPLLGAELQGRYETKLGSRWTVGARVGYGKSPEPVRFSFGWEAHLDVGTPFGNGGMFPDGRFYYGATVAPIWWIDADHEGTDLNSSSWFLRRAVELSPYLRVRAHCDGEDKCYPFVTRTDLGAGLRVRLRLINDFL